MSCDFHLISAQICRINADFKSTCCHLPKPLRRERSVDSACARLGDRRRTATHFAPLLSGSCRHGLCDSAALSCHVTRQFQSVDRKEARQFSSWCLPQAVSLFFQAVFFGVDDLIWVSQVAQQLRDSGKCQQLKMSRKSKEKRRSQKSLCPCCLKRRVYLAFLARWHLINILNVLYSLDLSGRRWWFARIPPLHRPELRKTLL